jgi:hypothetical protein
MRSDWSVSLDRQPFKRIKAVLMPVLNLFTSLLQQASQGTRSTILNPLAWFFSICVVGLIASVGYRTALWIQVLLACFTSLSGLLYLASFIFCLATKQPNLLRSERFLIQQLAIEKGFRGDSMTGLVLADPSTRQIESGEKIEGEQR